MVSLVVSRVVAAGISVWHHLVVPITKKSRDILFLRLHDEGPKSSHNRAADSLLRTDQCSNNGTSIHRL